jgi:hypothetical protein
MHVFRLLLMLELGAGDMLKLLQQTCPSLSLRLLAQNALVQ